MGELCDLLDVLKMMSDDDFAGIIREVVVTGVQGIELEVAQKDTRVRVRLFFEEHHRFEHTALIYSGGDRVTMRAETATHYIDLKFDEKHVYLFFRLLGYRLAIPLNAIQSLREMSMPARVFLGWRDGETRNLYIPVAW